MRKVGLISCLLLWLCAALSAQDYYLNGYAGFGYARFMTDLDLEGLNPNGFNGKIRLMWKPEHLLSVGIEAGYHYLYSYSYSDIATDFGVTDVSSSLTALPIFLVAGMEITSSIELLGGIGPSILYTFFESHGNETKSSQLSASYFIAGRYQYPINESLALGGELNFYHIDKIEDSTLSLQFILSYHLQSW